MKGERLKSEDIKTEVFFFPAAAHSEKDGSFTNTQRLLQWHFKAIDPPDDCRSDLHFVYHLGKKLKELYAGFERSKDKPIKDLTWDYPVKGNMMIPMRKRFYFEINGFTPSDKKPVSGFTSFKR